MSSEVSAETHVFVGLFREPFATVLAKAVKSQCPVCHRWWYSSAGQETNAVHTCWLIGHFDTPVYKTIEEVTRLQKPPEVVKPPPEPKVGSRSTMWPEDAQHKPPTNK